MAARKMMLVPADFFDNAERRSSMKTDPTTNLKIELDREMEQILSSKLPDFEKAALYNTILQKFLNLHYKHQLVELDQPKSVAPKLTNIREPTPAAAAAPELDELDPIIDMLPTGRYLQHARQIVRSLKNADNTFIDWNEDGSKLLLNDKYVQGANMVDLLHHLLKTKAPQDPPLAFDAFKSVLAQLPIATTWIPNSKVRREIEQLRKTTHNVIPTPASPATSTATATPASVAGPSSGAWHSFSSTPAKSPYSPSTRKKFGVKTWKKFD